MSSPRSAVKTSAASRSHGRHVRRVDPRGRLRRTHVLGEDGERSTNVGDGPSERCDEREPRARGIGIGRGQLAADRDPPGGRAEHASDAVEERGLARTVWADDGADLTRMDSDGNVIEAAQPPLDPRGELPGCCGLSVSGNSALPVHAESASSEQFVLPTSTAPAARIRATAGASSLGTCSASARVPAVVRMSAVAMTSFTVNGTPASGPGPPSPTASGVVTTAPEVSSRDPFECFTHGRRAMIALRSPRVLRTSTSAKPAARISAPM